MTDEAYGLDRDNNDGFYIRCLRSSGDEQSPWLPFDCVCPVCLKSRELQIRARACAQQE